MAAAPGVRAALGAARLLVWDPHPRGGDPLPDATVVTPNAAEAAAALHRPPASDLAAACVQVRDLLGLWRARAVALTLGARGAVLAGGTSSVAAFPATPSDGDPCGAGDRFAAAVTVALARGALPSEAVGAGVEAAGAFVAAGGVRTVGTADAPPARRSAPDDAGRPAVLVATGGCFDLLHAGHIATLEAARALGDRLVVCVNSDASVRRAKGSDRPVQPLADRIRVLRGLRAVDDVAVFDEDTPGALLRRLRPDVWVKGGDYAGRELPESPLVRSWGGQVVTVPYLAGRSTTSLLARGPR